MSFERELGGELLASVARSFYLSLKFLPGEIRGAASLGYLLARATDTVADTDAVPAEGRLRLLAAMGQAIAGEGAVLEFKGSLVAQSASVGEAALLAKFGRCLEWLRVVPRWQRKAIRKVLASIVKGQSDDLRRFGGGVMTGLATAEELEQYAYDVAGCVGVFWTDLGFGAFGSDFATRSRDEMAALGEAYGKGLQLLNILRDLPGDLRVGRCYLPVADPASSGREIWSGEARRWRARCRELLEAAPDYLAALVGRRMRVASALPVLIGGRTLTRLEQASWAELESGVKVPRAEVKKLVARAALASVRRTGLAALSKKVLASAG